MFSSPAMQYDAHRRRRRWEQGNRGLQGYADFLTSVDPSTDAGAINGATSAAMADVAVPNAWRSIAIGVTTGAITFLLNRFLERAFK